MKKVLLEAFALTNKKDFFKWWFGSSISTAIALLTLGEKFLDLSKEHSLVFGVVIFVIIYCFRYAYFVLKVGYKHIILKYRESIYGDAIIFLKDGFSYVHQLRKSENFDDKAFISVLSYMCNHLKDIYDRKTGSKCAVSIKALKGIESEEGSLSADMEVFNICRDKISNEKRTSTKYLEVKHQVFSNTCYNFIFDSLSRKRKNRLYYINNNLPTKLGKNSTNSFYPQSDNYQNTSYEVYDELPYKSEIVVPIIPILNDEKNHVLLGFICVDCEQSNVFDETYDLAILQGVADGIYDLFVQRIKSQKKTQAI